MNRVRSRPVPTTRNPYRGKGLRLPVVLLLEPGRSWSLRELADEAGVSDALTSGVIKQLRREGALPDEVVQGRRAAVSATEALLASVAANWPPPDLYIQAGHPPRRGYPIGGHEALAAAGFLAQGRTRVYVRSWEDADRLLGRTGGEEVPEPVADWEISVLDIDLPNGLLPPAIAALELGASPRGRQLLKEHANQLIPDRNP